MIFIYYRTLNLSVALPQSCLSRPATSRPVFLSKLRQGSWSTIAPYRHFSIPPHDPLLAYRPYLHAHVCKHSMKKRAAQVLLICARRPHYHTTLPCLYELHADMSLCPKCHEALATCSTNGRGSSMIHKLTLTLADEPMAAWHIFYRKTPPTRMVSATA